MQEAAVAVLERNKHVGPSREIGSDPHIRQRAAEAIELIEDGLSIKKALEQVGLKRPMFGAALHSERELATRYARALELSADFLVDEGIEAAREHPDVNRARVIGDMNRWAASKRNQKRYGDRIDLNVTQTMDVRGVLADAQARRLRTVCDQQDIEDAQVIDVKAIQHVGDTDSQSVAEPDPRQLDLFAEPAPVEPDIFS